MVDFLLMAGLVDFDAVLGAAQRGDERAVAALYREFQPRLAGFLRAREPRAADDIGGEVWLAVAQGLKRFSGGQDAFRAWVFSIAHRRLADYRRTAARRGTVPVPTEDLERPSAHDPETLALENVSTAAATAFVTATLSPDQAEVVLLRVIGGLDVEQVAKLLGKRPGTIRVLQHRALRRLQAELEKGRVTR
jgi:RNA polymerase sigma-70 factor (ECF subfamily)